VSQTRKHPFFQTKHTPPTFFSDPMSMQKTTKTAKLRNKIFISLNPHDSKNHPLYLGETGNIEARDF
jgi:hypothetical protein